jgi:hypothetical protein
MWKALTFFCLGLAGLTACSSGSGGGAGGSTGAPVSCETYCDKGLALSCATNTREQCLAACESDSNERGECADEYRASGACLIDTFGCELPNTAEADLFSVCQNQSAAYSGCSACMPDAEDDACDVCAKTNCCNERKSAYSDLELLEVAACYADCVDNGGLDCENPCLAAHPNAAAKVNAATACASNACPGC